MASSLAAAIGPDLSIPLQKTGRGQFSPYPVKEILMKTRDLSTRRTRISKTNYRMLRLGADGYTEEAFDEVQAESALDIFLNDEPVMRLICDSSNIVALVVGRLFTEGFIRGIRDVEQVQVNRHATEAYVTLSQEALQKRAENTDCSESISVATHGALQREFSSSLCSVEPVSWSPDDIFAIARVFSQDSPMHKRTFGAHSCYVALGNRVLFCCEDLGRHNAFDKAIGRALIEGLDLKRVTVFTSGRTPADMTTKAIRAGIPLLASKAVPTDLTIELARKHGLTLICSAHPDSIRVFNDPLGCAEMVSSKGELPRKTHSRMFSGFSKRLAGLTISSYFHA